ncbi:hypothetical protein M413DRAFT_439109 [Hebeloma cylindrosporum]|uniref:2,5-diamino-6-ribosylamino-4(3H)-pyrimidinone 5'-phosphate reductase n=1 Tax=Hebeloma cylindrosporum TaxID=76867 RepID=A0A0C2YC38_HEBCY|nr:hypothetical protein M413DRAFT_439109 [Hebeloma cylindrosporum h7]
MVMTHWMRTMHDAILVGIGTAINDDPQLNVRHLPHPPPKPYHLPRPIIIDSQLRLPPTCKLLHNYKNGTGRRPWIISSLLTPPEHQQRRSALETAGAKIIEVPPSRVTTNRIPIASMLQILRDSGINSLMVEGGARIINSFLGEEDTVDALIITIAPVFVGEAGVGYRYPTLRSENGDLVARYKEVHTEVVGRDTVVSLIPVKQNL